MSGEASGWAYRHSPYQGAVFAVHVAIGDAANDANDHELWFATATLAAKARVSRASVVTALRRMVEDGYLERLDEPDVAKMQGRPARYRMLFPAGAAVVYNTRGGARSLATPKGARSQSTPDGGVDTERAGGCALASQGVASQRAHNPREPNENPSNVLVGTPAAPASDATPSISKRRDRVLDPDDPKWAEPRRLCDLLADLIAADGAARPRVSDAWLIDMERLIRIDQHTPEQVERAIRWCQADAFWCRNILSPAKLREKYVQLQKAAKHSGRPARPTLTPADQPRSSEERAQRSQELTESYERRGMEVLRA